MNIRKATALDEAALRELWEAFEKEVPEPPGAEPETWAEEWADVQRDIDAGAVFLAEDDDGAVGTARATAPRRGTSHLHLVYVRERARRQGLAKALVQSCVHEVREQGATRITLDVLSSNAVARNVWSRLGFEEIVLTMASPLDALDDRLSGTQVGPSRGAIHVQSDDDTSIQRAVAGFVPRLEAPQVTASPSGWTRIADEVFDEDRDAQFRFARDLSDRLGAVVAALAVEHGAVVRFRLYETGRMVDEYLSVPTYHGPLSKGDELALEANPTLVARLTGADRDTVRAVMRTGASPSDLPPAEELYAQVARTMGLEP